MKVCTIGGATQDIFIHNKHAQTIEFNKDEITQSFVLLPEGSKLEIDSLAYKTGGGCTNSATAFQRLGFETELFFKVGNDAAASFIKKEVEFSGLSTRFVAHTPSEKSGVSLIIPSPDGDSSVLAYRGANATITQQDIPEELFKDSALYYITSLSGQSSHLLPYITQRARAAGGRIASNPGRSQLATDAMALRTALTDIEILILNAQEAQIFMHTLAKTQEIASYHGHTHDSNAPHLLKNLLMYEDRCFSISHFFSEVMNRGPKIIAVTNGKEGVYVASGSTIFFHPGLETHLVNTVGAGDAFGSCFVASILQDNSLPEAMLHGIINASSVISFLDAKEGLLPWHTIHERSKFIGLSRLQTFSF